MDWLFTVLILGVSYRVVKYLYEKFVANEPKSVATLGKWAVVTGATDGIGRAFAENFASKGFDVVLVSRSQSKLETVAKEIQTKFKVSTKVLQADFTSLDDQMYSRIENEIKDLEVGVLVNNVGVSYTHPEYFLELKNNHGNLYSDIINCNISSTVNMCRYVLPGMASRGRGWIINMSSGLADIPAPMLALYAASKSFISKFSLDLGVEYASKGVKVQCLKPGLVATNMSAIRKTSWMVPSPKQYVESALADLETTDCSEGYFSHVLVIKAVVYITCVFPDFIAKQLVKINLSTKKKALKKCKNCNNLGDKED